MLRALLRLPLLAALMLAGGQAGAQQVALSGILGSKALLVVDTTEPKAVGPGETHRGVKVVSAQGDTAVVEIGGQRQSLRIGGAPVSVGSTAPSGAGTRIVMSADSAGHFVASGSINGRAVQFLVDTGATTLGIGIADAERIGLKYREGRPVEVGTANGVARGWQLRLRSVRLNDIEVYDVDAIVTPISLPYVLLGNTFLTRFQMTRTNEQLVLERRF